MSRQLLELLGKLPDPRGRNGRQYPLAALLGLCLVATLAGYASRAVIAASGACPPQRQAEWDAESESASGKGHGRCEARSLVTTTWLNDDRRDWPGLAQAFRLVRRRTVKGVTSEEVV